MKIALLSATTASIKPIENAIDKIDSSIKYYHLLDSSLLPMLKEEGKITQRIIQRFIKLINLAQSTSGTKAVLFTCSAFNNIADLLQPIYNIKLYRSDEGMIKEASKYEKVGIISTVSETPEVLISYLKELNPHIHIKTKVKEGLLKFIELNKNDIHDNEIIKIVNEIQNEVDVVLLSQYSMAHVKQQLNINKPILTAPDMSVQLLLKDLF